MNTSSNLSSKSYPQVLHLQKCGAIFLRLKLIITTSPRGSCFSRLQLILEQAKQRKDKNEESKEINLLFQTKAGAAKALNVSLSTVNRMIRDGQLSAVKIRGCVRIPEDSISGLLETNLSGDIN